MLLVLRLGIGEQFGAVLGPVVDKGVFVTCLHEAVDTDEVEVTLLASRQLLVRRYKGVVHGSEPLLPVQHDVLAVAVTPGISVNVLAGKRVEVLLLALPQQQAADVVVEENRAHQVTDVPRFPFELALKIRDDETTFFQPGDQGVQADVVGFLGVLHAALPTMSANKPSLSRSRARMSARISSSVRIGAGL